MDSVTCSFKTINNQLTGASNSSVLIVKLSVGLMLDGKTKPVNVKLNPNMVKVNPLVLDD